MRIGIFGNTNNYPYVLAAGLRTLGADVRLVVSRAEPLNRPESKIAGYANGYPEWILDASPIAEEDFVVESPRISNVVNFVSHDVDAVILNHIGPSLYRLIEKPALALLTGSDLLYCADFASAAVRRAAWDPEFTRSPGGRLTERKWTEFVARQRDGILASEGVSFGSRGLVPDGDRLLDEIGVGDSHRLFLYIADTHHLQPQPAPLNKHLRILNGARLTWVRPLPAGFSSQDDKATDVLLTGFNQFIRQGGSGELRLVAKGLHVRETETLVDKLGIREHVVWLEEMPLAAFRREMAAADVVCDNLGASFPGMTALDSMALGRPVLANFRLDILSRLAEDPWPVCHAVSPQDVAEALLGLAASAPKRAELGDQARAFAERHLSPEMNARRCLERLGVS